MPDKIDRQAEPRARTDNTLGVDDQSTQPSSIEKSVDANLPIEFGRYRLLKQLGEGGMGVVYLAHDIELDRQIALKLPHFSGAKSKDLAQRFRREARLAATLDHPNICRIYDISEYERRLFLTMAFVEGKSLHELIRSKGAIEPRTAVTLLRRIAQAVHYAHSRGVIHRDLKPANIMIKKDRDFVIMDFGLARRIDQEEAQLTATGAVLGTPAYMAPEQLRGEKGASGPQSDVYSLGIIFYELLTGQRPFQGTLPQIYAQVLTTDSVSPSLVRDSIETALDEICQKATNREASQRYESAEEFAAALGQYLNAASNPVDATRIPVRQQQSKLEPTARAGFPPRRRKPTMLIAIGGAAFFTILLMGVIVVLVRNKDGTTTELRLPDGALAVEVQKDKRTIVTVDVADEAQPQASEHTEVSSDQSRTEEKVSQQNTNVSGLSESQAIRLLQSHWSLYFEAANGAQFIIKPLDTIEKISGKLVAIRADEKQGFPSTYVSEIFVPCIAAIPSLVRIEGTGQFTYSEQEFLNLAHTPFAKNGTILSGAWVPLTPKVIDSLKNSFHKVEFISLFLEQASDHELRSIASLKNLRTVWFNSLGDSVGPAGVDAIAGMSLDFMGLFLARKFTQAELRSLGNAYAQNFEFLSSDFDDSDLAIFAKQSPAQFLRLGSTKVTDQGIMQLQFMTRLKQVDLKNTPCDISAIQALSKRRPDLTIYWSGGTITGSEIARGTAVFEISSIDVKAVYSIDGNEYRRSDLEGPMELPVGVHGVTVTVGNRTLLKESFVINANQRKIVTLTLIDSERQAAIRFLKLGGMLQVSSDGNNKVVKEEGNLPGTEFRILRAEFFANQRINDDDLKYITASPDLEEIQLYNTYVTDAGLAFIRNKNKLKYLGLGNTKITETGLVALLATLPKLNHLAVGNTDVGDQLAATIARLPITVLEAHGTKIGDNGIAHLKGSSCCRISLENTSVTDAGLEHFKKFRKIESLNLRNTKVTDAGVASLQKTFPDCKIERKS